MASVFLSGWVIVCVSHSWRAKHADEHIEGGADAHIEGGTDPHISKETDAHIEGGAGAHIKEGGDAHICGGLLAIEGARPGDQTYSWSPGAWLVFSS